ncbi:adenylate/guanylate cyclase domain-containing protein [Simkania negevensis]|uniref:Adenylate cyclase n=1 Tax=Simkania negevensis (strain ATCC VR-1471 / DSM 27360 / Z) TaxID=331113 RepID=F8L968_SIMNZ|nr:adenylate/guanylate cyclase domain-containing protein [Simkania negevensis]CCB89383.1 adenylate cyclase [Simkania negevensis Z]
MKLHLKKDRFLTYFFVFLGILILSLFSCLIVLQHLSKLQIMSANDRYESFLLAQELREGSDNLTKMVRLYVMTGDPKYRKYFEQILAIRNGEEARPANYFGRIYWDLIIPEDTPSENPGIEKKSLKQLMLEQGFTLEEFALLDKAEEKSNALAKIETKAMDAVEGKYVDEEGKIVSGSPNRELAQKMVFGKAYLEYKKDIMIPLDEFLQKVEKRTEKRNKELNHKVLLVISIAILLALFSTIVMIISIYRALSSLAKTTSDTELLLLNVLPSPIADRLKHGEEPIADEIPQASVLFADIVGFTNTTLKYGASKMVMLLNQLFDTFDLLSDQYGVEKVKTIGDNYMAVSGVPEQVPDHAIRMANFALAILEKVKEFNDTHKLNFELRIGMTYGSVIAGVIGHKKFIYDVWGDVVNIASRMESTGESGKIQITDKMAMMLSEKFEVQERKEVDVSGIGKIKTFFLIGKKGPPSAKV